MLSNLTGISLAEFHLKFLVLFVDLNAEANCIITQENQLLNLILTDLVPCFVLENS